jgi:hypothetical protein
MDNRTKILIAYPLILIIILIMTASSISFEKEPLDKWKTIKFVPSTIVKKYREEFKIGRYLKSPIDFGTTGTSQGVLTYDALNSLEGYNDKDVLSLIVISDNNKMAIIKGFVVKEGDNIGGIKVIKIERNRVLLKDNTTKWIYLRER